MVYQVLCQTYLDLMGNNIKQSDTGTVVRKYDNSPPTQPSPVKKKRTQTKAIAQAFEIKEVLEKIFIYCDPIQDRWAVSLTCKEFDSDFKNIEFSDGLNIFSKDKQDETFTKLFTTIESNEQLKSK